jgi:hypothetical protein
MRALWWIVYLGALAAALWGVKHHWAFLVPAYVLAPWLAWRKPAPAPAPAPVPPPAAPERGPAPETVELARRDRLIESLSRQLVLGLDTDSALEAVLNTARGLVTARSIILFLPDHEGRLAPASFLSPEQERLTGASLAGLREPLVEHAFSGGLPVSRPGAEGDPMLSEERCAVALPFGTGVLFDASTIGFAGPRRMTSATRRRRRPSDPPGW